MKKVYIYKAFERFWHWSQAILMITLMLTGFEIHGSYTIFGFERSVMIHNTAAWSYITLLLFSIFWHLITGEWKQYIPTKKLIVAQTRFYLTGIFKQAPHPFKKNVLSKLNPLQKIVYFFLKMVMIPLMLVSGIFYMYVHNIDSRFADALSVDLIAVIHTIGAFSFVVFLIAHLYLITTGHKVSTNVKAMLTGWEYIEMEEEEKKKAEGEVAREETDNK